MIMGCEYLSQHPNVFQKCTGLTAALFDQLVDAVLPLYLEAEDQRLNRPQRQRTIGAGHPFEMTVRDHLLLTILWLRLYSIQEVLAYLFRVSDYAGKKNQMVRGALLWPVWSSVCRVLPLHDCVPEARGILPHPLIVKFNHRVNHV
jgi:hypothetical protein